MWISVRTQSRQIILELLPYPPDHTTLALENLLTPLSVQWHEMDEYVFLKQDGENFLLGTRTAIAKSSLDRIRKTVEHILLQPGAIVIHDTIAPRDEGEG